MRREEIADSRSERARWDPDRIGNLDDFSGAIFFFHRLIGKVDRLICYLRFAICYSSPQSTVLSQRFLSRLGPSLGCEYYLPNLSPAWIHHVLLRRTDS